jgi:hypothetical protein
MEARREALNREVLSLEVREWSGGMVKCELRRDVLYEFDFHYRTSAYLERDGAVNVFGGRLPSSQKR